MSYFYLPDLIQNRLKYACSKIDTRHVMMCSDNEFMLPSTLQKYINFLEDNSNYSTVCGKVVGFNYKDGRIQLWGFKSKHRSHQVTKSLV
jgi:hypothetical protein